VRRGGRPKSLNLRYRRVFLLLTTSRPRWVPIRRALHLLDVDEDRRALTLRVVQLFDVGRSRDDVVADAFVVADAGPARDRESSPGRAVPLQKGDTAIRRDGVDEAACCLPHPD
jgi:hypothetical protein